MNLCRKGLLLLAGLALCLTLSGCGYKELHQRILIQGIGVDRASQGYRVTVRAASTVENAREELFLCQGDSVLEALSNLSLSIGREPFYSHNYLVVFGRSCGEEGLDKSMDFFIRYYNTRPAVQVYLAENTAEEILSAQAEDALISMQELQQLGQSGTYNGKALAVDFLEFVNGVKRPGSSPVMPVLRLGERGVELGGTAYFQEYVLRDVLSREETRGYLAMQGDLRGGEVVVSDPEFGTVTLTLSRCGGKRTVFLEEGTPVFRTVVTLEADVSAISGGRSRLEERFYSSVEAALASQVRQEMEEVFQQALVEDRCDIFGFGTLLYQKAPQLWKELQWEEEMVCCRYQWEVEATVLRMEQENFAVAGE